MTSKILATWGTRWYESNSAAKDAIAKTDGALIARRKWNSNEITWSTPSTGAVEISLVRSGEQARFTPFTQVQIDALSDIFEYLSLATGLKFRKVDSGLGNINFGFGNLKRGGYAGYPNLNGVSADVRLRDSDIFEGQFTHFGYMILIHELGHALGLEHPHEVGVTAETDTGQSSIMSYNSYAHWEPRVTPPRPARWGKTFMPSDIYALRSMYGANNGSTNKTIYEFSSTLSMMDELDERVILPTQVEGNTILIDMYSPSYIFTDTGTVDIDLRKMDPFPTFINLEERILGSRMGITTVQADERQENNYRWEVVQDSSSINFNESFEEDVASCLINPRASISTIWGSRGSDLIKGDASDNTIYADVDNDIIIRTSGNDFYDGGDRIREYPGGRLIRDEDKLVIEDSITNYKIIREVALIGKSIFSLISKSDGSKSRCTDFEIYAFKDLTLDLVGTFDQVTGLNTADAHMFRLYNAAFARIPDDSGLRYWINEYSKGITDYRNISQSFLNAEEFKTRYGANNSNTDFINNMYRNIFGRIPDEEGRNYWVSNLESGRDTRVDVLGGFAESTENKNLFSQVTGFT